MSKTRAITASLFVITASALFALSACSDDTPAQPDSGGADTQAAAGDASGGDTRPATDSGVDARLADVSTPDQAVSADASPSAKHYLFWQSPGGFARTGPAIEIFGDGKIRFWKQSREQAPEQTMSSDQEIQTSPAFVHGLFQLLEKVDFSKLPNKVSPQAECWPSFYWRKCFSCKPTTFVHNRVSGLRPQMDAVLRWIDTNLGTKSEAPMPSKFCFGA